MAVIITHKAEDISAQTQGKVNTVERLMQVSADTFIEVISTSKIPKPDSRHPGDSTLVLQDRSFEIVGNLGRKTQVAVRLTYSDEGNNDDGDKDPWELDAQNVSVSYSTEPAPMHFGYNAKGEKVPLVNSAGGRLLVEGQNTIRQISFTFCVKSGKTGEAPVNNKALINSSDVKVAGYTIAPFEGLLMPMNAQFVADVDDEGEIYRRYWQIQAVILENERTWLRKALDVGTMARFIENQPPQPIYQFTPWTDPKPENNFNIPPVYGNIDKAIEAKIQYAKKFPGAQYQAKFDELPCSEITEPLPLLNGKVYIDAMKDPIKNPYKTVDYFETKPTSWAKWNLPKKRA